MHTYRDHLSKHVENGMVFRYVYTNGANSVTYTRATNCWYMVLL